MRAGDAASGAAQTRVLGHGAARDRFHAADADERRKTAVSDVRQQGRATLAQRHGLATPWTKKIVGRENKNEWFTVDMVRTAHVERRDLVA